MPSMGNPSEPTAEVGFGEAADEFATRLGCDAPAAFFRGRRETDGSRFRESLLPRRSDFPAFEERFPAIPSYPLRNTGQSGEYMSPIRRRAAPEECPLCIFSAHDDTEDSPPNRTPAPRPEILLPGRYYQLD